MKLTAAGLDFGENTVTLPDGTWDSSWAIVKEQIIGADIFEEMRKATVLVSRESARTIMTGYLKDAFPEGLPDKDYKRYIEEMLDMLYEK